MTPHLDALTLSRWADELLSPDEQRRALAHLAQCAECRAQAAGQAATARRLRRLALEPAPAGLTRAIRMALARRRASERVWTRVAAGSAVAALAGAALLAVAVPDLARLLPGLTSTGAPLAATSGLLDVPADALAGLGALAGSAWDWGAALSGGAGVALMIGLVLLTVAAFAGLARLLRPALAGPVTYSALSRQGPSGPPGR